MGKEQNTYRLQEVQDLRISRQLARDDNMVKVKIYPITGRERPKGLQDL